MNQGSCSSRVISGVDAIDASASSWFAPVSSAPFTDQGYALAILSAYHHDDDPKLVLSIRQERIVASLPVIRRPVARWNFRINEWGCPFNPNSILNAPLREGQDVDAAGAVIVGAFSTGADTIVLDNLPVACGTASSFAAAAATVGAGADQLVASRTFLHADVRGGWVAYLAARSGNHRRQIAKAMRAMDSVDGIEAVCLSGADAIEEALPEWFAVERRSWQGAQQASAMTEMDRTFHATLLRTLPACQVGHLWLVRLRGRPVAALRMLAAPGKLAVHTMHFDAGQKALAPGLIAFASMMEAACEGDVDEVDMHGNTDFFERWASGARAHASIRLYRPGLRGMILRRGRRLATAVSRIRQAARSESPKANSTR